MGATLNRTLQSSVTKTAAFTGSWVGTGVINKPISASIAGNMSATVIVDVSAITGAANFRLVGKDPVSGNTYDIPGGALPTILEIGTKSITIEGPFPAQVALAVDPEEGTAGDAVESVTYTGSLQLWG